MEMYVRVFMASTGRDSGGRLRAVREERFCVLKGIKWKLWALVGCYV